jgi:hypothetical protein
VGLEEGRHFAVKMPGGGEAGFVRILREGLAYAAWLSMYGSVEQRRTAAEFVEYILQRAWDAGETCIGRPWRRWRRARREVFFR